MFYPRHCLKPNPLEYYNSYILICGVLPQLSLLTGTGTTFISWMTSQDSRGSIHSKWSRRHSMYLKASRSLWKNHSKENICAVQCDWGGEYRLFASFLAEQGIALRHLCPHVHTQNWRGERLHRHIMELGLSMLAQAQLPLDFSVFKPNDVQIHNQWNSNQYRIFSLDPNTIVFIHLLLKDYLPTTFLSHPVHRGS